MLIQVQLIEKLITFCTKDCKETLRQEWESEMSLFNIRSEKRCILVSLFIKATNGVVDRITVLPFKELTLIQMMNCILSSYHIYLTDCLYVVRFIRKYLKWVRNTYMVVCIWLTISLRIMIQNFQMK